MIGLCFGISCAIPTCSTFTAHETRFLRYLWSQVSINPRLHGPSLYSSSFNPSSKLGISFALFAGLLHFTIPCLSTPKLPAVCHLLPLSVGLFQIPSSLPSFNTLHRLHGLSVCQKLDTPRPQRAYSSRSASIMTSTGPAPPTESTHLAVASASLCETATKCVDG